MADGTITIDVELNEKAFKASLENMGAIVKSGSDLMIESVNNLSSSFIIIPKTISTVLNSVPNIINGVINNITGKNPEMTQAGTELFTSLIGDMPHIVGRISSIVPEITNTVKQKIIGFMPDMSDTGNNFFTSLISNMPEIISEITGAVPKITEQTAQAFSDGEIQMSQVGYDLFCSVGNLLPQAIKEIIKAPEQIISIILSKFNSLIPDFMSVGENIVYGVWAGISSMGSWLANSVTSFFQGIVNTVTGFLGISSPSKLFRDLVGKNIALGVKSGIDSEMSGVISGTQAQMSRLADAAAQSSRMSFGAADIMGRTDGEITRQTLKRLPPSFTKEGFGNGNSEGVPAEINVTLEPTGDIRGFFDYIRMGVKRSGYLSGE